ncbi:MAG: GGDEF domain-containing protein [Arhodomonas sp.]|nr:GGDEF domain-containing protein [Arhodomonas sp.]
MEAELERLATHDRLTGIYNRTKLYERLDIAREENERYGTPFSVVMFDIDHFKAINDTYGHGAGDAVLRELTERVQGVLRETDHLGRWGGEEFLILAGHADRAGAEQLAERIREVVADEPFPTVGAVTVSLGVFGIPGGRDPRAPGRTGRRGPLCRQGGGTQSGGDRWRRAREILRPA